MKKMIALSVAALMAVSLAGCGAIHRGVEKVLGMADASKAPSASTSAPTTHTPDKPDDADKPSQSKTPTGDSELGFTVEEAVLVDQNDVKITLTGVESSFSGPDFKMLVENNRDEPITVQVRNASVNGIMVDPVCSTDVSPGKKTNDTIGFWDWDLEAAGIQTIGQFEFEFLIFNEDTFDDIFQTDPITIRTSADGTFEQAFDENGTVVHDADGLQIVVQRLMPQDEDDADTEVLVYIRNDSDRDITVMVEEASVEGYTVDPAFSCDVMAGKRAYPLLRIDQDDLESNGLSALTSLSVSFDIADMDSWETIVTTKETEISFE